MSNLIEERLSWNNMVLAADLQKETPHTSLQIFEKEILSPPPTPPEAPKNNTEFGNCRVCHQHRRLWAQVCAWCGADPEEEE